MKYEVRIVHVALDDLFAIYRYVALNDSPGKAEHLLDNLHKVMSSLESMPARGNHPPEMQRWGVFDFREVFFKPYRIIYEIREKTVFIHAVIDGGVTARIIYSNGFWEFNEQSIAERVEVGKDGGCKEL